MSSGERSDQNPMPRPPQVEPTDRRLDGDQTPIVLSGLRLERNLDQKMHHSNYSPLCAVSPTDRVELLLRFRVPLPAHH